MVEALAAWPGAAYLRTFGTAYLLVNAAHVLGLSVLVGAILPLDLRLLGLFRSAPVAVLAPVLVRSAACGAGLAVATGLWLFTVRPAEYLANPAFLAKLALLAAALLTVALQHRGGLPTGDAVPFATRLRAAASLALWLAVLLAGRWIGFA